VVGFQRPEEKLKRAAVYWIHMACTVFYIPRPRTGRGRPEGCGQAAWAPKVTPSDGPGHAEYNGAHTHRIVCYHPRLHLHPCDPPHVSLRFTIPFHGPVPGHSADPTTDNPSTLHSCVKAPSGQALQPAGAWLPRTSWARSFAKEAQRKHLTPCVTRLSWQQRAAVPFPRGVSTQRPWLCKQPTTACNARWYAQSACSRGAP
jgi:hypothetical protein